MRFHSIANFFPLIEGDDFEQLVADIKENGLVQPIWLHPEDESIIDGRNRFRACKKAGVEPKFKKWDGRGSLIAFVMSMNLKRRHLTPGQRAALAVDLLPVLEKEAAARRNSQLKRGSVSPILDTREAKGRAAENAALVVGVGRSYISMAKKLKEESPELYADVRAGKKSLQDAKQAMKDQHKAALVRQIRAEPVPLPRGPFRVIVVDPPWRFRYRAEDPTHRARSPYPDMSLDEIKALPIPALAHRDCILWVWRPNGLGFATQLAECLAAWASKIKRS